jgi:glycosyltransferase involved in cell wall biosynthesis
MKPILFISHDAHRRGAPMVLLHLCRWMARHHQRSFEVVLCRGGELEPEFAALAPTTTIGLGEDEGRANGRLRALAARVAEGDFSLIYANTVEAAEVLDACPAPGTPVLTHVHELDYRIRQQTGLERFRLVCDRSDRFIAVSEAVRRNLVDGHDLDPEAVELVYEFIDTSRWSLAQSRVDTLRTRLNLPANALVVGGSGTLDWRKGPDLFVQIAGALKRTDQKREVHWVWVGGDLEDEWARLGELRHDAARLGVGARVHFVGEQANPSEWFAGFDLFLLTSREDPYPLVALEAAASSIPIVCFADAGGAPEFVEEDCGAVVPYLDVAAAADAIATLLGSDTARHTCGSRAQAKVRARHDVSVAAPRVAAIIEMAIPAGPSAARLDRMTLAAPVPRTTAIVFLYQMASDFAAAGEVVRARTLFEAIVAKATDDEPALAGKAWFKLATLAVDPAEALRCCDRAIDLLPTHQAARDLRDTLLAAEPIHG